MGKKLRAVQAKFEAQKIAFAPLAFQGVRALIETNILRCVSGAGERGLSSGEIAEQTGISLYGVGVLAELALDMGIFEAPPREDAGQDPGAAERFVLGKIGWFLLEDEMTRVNFNFVNDVCYRGAFFLADSVRSKKPRGLSVFGEQWKTIYEALSSLPPDVRKSWFEFDHFYSDTAFPAALPIVFERSPRHIMDIGGNTAKWAAVCCSYDPEVTVTIVDLPGQTAEAEKNAAAAGLSRRISVYPCNVLDRDVSLPSGADAVWMSQFLDCFSPEEITRILKKTARAVGEKTDVFILEPLTDMQKYEAAAYSLRAVSLYFTCMANGNSKMYRFGELKAAVEQGGFRLAEAHHNLGANAYSLLRFRKAV